MRLGSILAGVVLAAFAAVASAQQPIVIKFSHVVAPDTPKGRGAEKFKELANQYTNGRVSVEIYPNSRLYKDIEELEALGAGWVQMLAPTLSKLSLLRIHDFEVFDLPYLFPDREALFRVTDGEIGQRLLKKLEAKGIVGLAYWDNAFKQMSANRPLRMPADLKGVKLRVQPGSRVLEAQMRALGATPLALPFSEVYPALQARTVLGTENPVSNFYTQSMHRVQKHLTISDHGYLGYVVIVSKKFWDGLPSDVRTGLERAMKEASAYEREVAQKDNDAALEAVRNAGTTEIHLQTPEERSAWRTALLPVHKQFESRIGREVLESVYDAVGRAK